MCDQTEVSYLDNDIVWVKIGPIWWPGVVRDLEKDEEGREILMGLKKKPIAAVKFFQEDNYEFVKNLDHIYHYNCRRKDEFIKKGLDKFRGGAPHMKKFPSDVTTAESLVNGDVNIINDPKFYPEKRQSYSEIFGSGKKKSKKESETPSKPKSQVSSTSTPYRPITHQRFINKVLHGESDHKVKTLIQPTSSPEDISRGLYRCHVCKFETARVNVIVSHHRLAHSSSNSINWTGSETKVVRRKSVYKSRKNKAKRLFESPKTDSSDDEYLDKKRSALKGEKPKSPCKKKDKSIAARKGSSLTSGKRKGSEETLEDSQKRPRFTDVLLADWSEDDEEEKKIDNINKNKDNDEHESENNQENTPDFADGSAKDELQESNKGKDEPKNQVEKKSCFDFDEEEEGFIGMSNANTYGRKIPRVIPLKDKTELGVDLDIGELFKKKSEDDAGDTVAASEETSALSQSKSNECIEECSDTSTAFDTESKVDEKVQETDKDEKTERKRLKRRRKSSKDQEVKLHEDSLAVRRTRRPGAKKTYLNEVIEKVEEDSGSLDKFEGEKEKDPENPMPEAQNIFPRKAGKDEIPSSSSRRKQDLKQQTMENNLEETIYPDIVSDEARTPEKKPRGKAQQAKNAGSDDLTRKIDHLLAETNMPSLPDIPDTLEPKSDKLSKSPEMMSKPSNTLNFSFDYVPPEGERAEKSKTEVKSITKMFSDTIKGNENMEAKDRSSADTAGVKKDWLRTKEISEVSEVKKVQSQNVLIGGMKIVSPQGSPKHSISGSNTVILHESSDELNPQIIKGESNTAEGNSTVVSGYKTEAKIVSGSAKEIQDNLSDTSENAAKTKNIKTLKLKADSLPSLLTPTGKLKGQAIIQKGGTYVILSQPPQIPRQKVATAKGQTPSKLVILTNHHGEQKIITTSGLQQSKFKIDPQKMVVATSSGGSASEANGAPSIISVGKTQPVIKMVPDGKGGVVKQLTVSPKKVLVGGTKVLVSGAGTNFSSQGNTIQKIALTGGNNLSGDFRLIENYKGSGKTVLIQGGSSTSSGVLLKSGTAMQRHTAGETVQGTPNILSVKKKPKILMRATPTQNEYVVHSDMSTSDSPTYVMKRKDADGKFSTQKIIRRPVINPNKAKSIATNSKTIILSSDQSVQKTESLIIKTSHEPAANKIIRLTQKVRETDLKPKFAQKIIQKMPESFTAAENLLTVGEPEEEEVKNETTQIVQVAQNEPQQSMMQTQVMAMPGPIGSDGNQTYVLVSLDEHGVMQAVDNSLITYDTSGQTESVFMDPGSNNNVIVISPQTNEEVKPVFTNGSQDILAEALANTNVLEGNMNNDMESVMPSILLPPSIPSSVVQETSITLQKPIMTPLEMPTSVAPDTSGLEPPPLPPTPTEEDVLMEDQDAELQGSSGMREESLVSLGKNKDHTNSKKLNSVMDNNEKTCKGDSEQQELIEENSEVNFDECKEKQGVDQKNDQISIREEFIIENSQEDQGSSSLQSMPLLNDEPDTSDDAQGSEPIADQDFELQKTRSENEGLSSLLREQEPPSSTNNEVMAESSFENPKPAFVTSCDAYNPIYEDNTHGDDSRMIEGEKSQEEMKSKEIVENREMQSMPVITDDGSINSYSFGQMYDSLSHKRFQEETEVTSTTDEYSNKDNNVV